MYFQQMGELHVLIYSTSIRLGVYETQTDNNLATPEIN